MAEFNTTTQIEATATITFGESELRALEAMTGYGIEAFLKVFYEKCGRHYMEPHEQGLRDLFATVNPPVSQALRQVDTVRDILRKSQQGKSRA